MEGIVTGLPMITWPGFSGQFLNERFLVDVLGIGVAVGVKTPVFWEMMRRDTMVKREEVEKAAERAMDGGAEAEERRRRARELGKMARSAMELGGSSPTNLTSLIDHVMHHLKNRKDVSKEQSDD